MYMTPSIHQWRMAKYRAIYIKKRQEILKMKMKKYGVLLCLVPMYVFLLAGIAEAGTAAGLPWEGALTTLSNSLTGPVAFALGLFMIVWCAQNGIESVTA